MKRKGFTLIELLLVIVLIALIFTITGVLVFNNFDSVKDKLNDAQKKLIIDSADSYVNEFRDKKDNWLENISDSGEITFCVSLNSLINSGYLKSSDNFLIENKDNLLVSVKIDKMKVYSYEVINNSSDDIAVSCMYSDVLGTLDKTEGSVDIKNDSDINVGNLSYDIKKYSNKEYGIVTNLKAELGTQEMEIDAPVYVAIILDNSGSMIGSSWTNAKNASIELSNTIINNIDNAKVALIQYGDYPMLVRNFENTPLNSSVFVNAYGSTNVSGSLDLISSLYKELSLPSYVKLFTILLYDGEVDYYSYLYGDRKSINSSNSTIYYDNFLSAFNGLNNTYIHKYGPSGNDRAKYPVYSANYLKDTIKSNLITIGYNFNSSSSLAQTMKTISSLDNEFCANSDYEEEIKEITNDNILSDVSLNTSQIHYSFDYDKENNNITSTNKSLMTESYEIYELDLTSYSSDDEIELAINYKSVISTYSDYFRIIISENSDKLTSVQYSGCTSGWNNNSFCNYSYSKEETTKTNIYGGKKYYIHFIYEKKSSSTNKDYGITINSISYSLVDNKVIYNSKEDGFNSSVASLSSTSESKIVYETKLEGNSLVLSSYGNPSITGGYKVIDLSNQTGSYLLNINASVGNRIGVIYVSKSNMPPITAAQYKIFSNIVGYEYDNTRYECNKDYYRCFWGKIENSDFSFKLEGGNIYYIHFVYYLKYSGNNSNFTINKMSLLKINDSILDVDLDKISDSSCLDYSKTISCLNKSKTYDYSFMPNIESFISTNKEVKNSCSHNYSIIDLTDYGDDEKFILNFKSIINSSSSDYGNIIISTSEETPTLNKMACDLNKDYICVNLSTSSVVRENVTSLNGGSKYYVHFMYCKNSGSSIYYSDYFGINKFTLYKGDGYTELKFDDIVNYDDYSFVEKDNKLVSTNEGKGNTISHSYMKIDLSNYSASDRFIISVDDIVSNSGYGIITLDSSSAMPIITFNYCSTNYSSYTLVCMASSRTGNDSEAKSHSTIVNGGKVYYLHFIYYKNSNNDKYNDIYTIDSVKVVHITSSDKKEIDLSKGLYNLENYSFREEVIDNKKVYISDDLGLYTNAHSYIKVDLSSYSSSEIFNINFDLSCKGNSGGCYIIVNQDENNPYYYYTSNNLKASYSRNKDATFNGELNGGKVYYVHFVNYVYNNKNGSLTISPITLSKVLITGKNSYCYYDSDTEQISSVFSNLSTKVIESIPKFTADKVKIILNTRNDNGVSFHIIDKVTNKELDSITKEININDLESYGENKILDISDEYYFVLDSLPNCESNKCVIETKIFDLELEIFSLNSELTKKIKINEDDLPIVRIEYEKGEAIN